MTQYFPTLDYLRHQIEGTLPDGAITAFRYPTPISTLLGFRVVEVGAGQATLTFGADPDRHGNQQGTVHGGMLAELADAAIGTAHSTVLEDGESFTSVDLKINFFRPVWKTTLTATACPIQRGRRITHYHCEIAREDGKLVALASGTMMTLRGNEAQGR